MDISLVSDKRNRSSCDSFVVFIFEIDATEKR